MPSEQEKNRSNAAERQLLEIAEMRAISVRRSAFSDIRQTILQAKPYLLWQRLLGYLRRLRMISFVIRMLTWLFAILQTGALVLLATAVLVVLLAILLVVLPILLLWWWGDRRRNLRRMRQILTGRRLYVLFSVDSSFGVGMMRAFAAEEQTVCIAVSRNWIVSTGLGKRRFYLHVRQEGDRLYLIRRHFFFALRKYLQGADLILIY